MFFTWSSLHPNTRSARDEALNPDANYSRSVGRVEGLQVGLCRTEAGEDCAAGASTQDERIDWIASLREASKAMGWKIVSYVKEVHSA